MDITAFVEHENKEEKLTNTNTSELKNHLGQLTTNKQFDMNDYSCMVEFIEMNGTLRNLNSVLELFNTNKNADKKIIQKALPKYFTIKRKKHGCKLKINKDIWRNLSELPTIKLTDEQLKCGKKLLKFMKDPNQAAYGLYGYAGTGKTTSTVEILSYLVRNSFINSVVFTAPTNKAVNVIKSKFRPHIKDIYEKFTGKTLEKDFDFENILDQLYLENIKIDFVTIHKLLEFKIDYNADGGLIFMRNNCGKKKISLMSQYEIVIVDECSMIPLDLLDAIFHDIRKSVENMTGKHKMSDRMKTPKIVFTGDPAQLPPVHESRSFIFMKDPDELTVDEYAEKMHGSSILTITSDMDSILKEKRQQLIDNIMNVKTFTLKNVVRSKIDNVTNLCYEIRKWVNGEEENPDFNSFNGKRGVRYYEYDPSTEKIRSKWFKKCVKYLEKGESSIILTWTNRQSDQYNEFIRKKIFGSKRLEKYVPGDILMLTEFYCLDINEEDEGDANKFYTSDQIIVVRTKKSTHKMKKFEFASNKSIRKMKKSLRIEHSCRQIISRINTLISRKRFGYWKLDVKKIGDVQNTEHAIKVLRDFEVEDYNELKGEISGYISNFTKQMLIDFKDTSKQIERLVIKPLWKQWHNVFVIPFAHVNYGYSITCHKGQGSNFYNVFVDIDDISKNGNMNEVKKCTYTAVTRTINKLYMLI